MGEVSSLRVGRFMRLPRRSQERWQGGIVRLPAWVEKPAGPFRPWGAIWVSRSTGLVNLELEPERNAHDWELALEALIEFGLKRGLVECRPAVLEVADEELGRRLRQALGDRELEIELAPGLSALDEVLTSMGEHAQGRRLPPGALEGQGVTVERMRAFATAARRFWEAQPWGHLTDEDLVQVEAPARRGLAHVAVLGAGRQVFGLGFFDSVEDHDAIQDDALGVVEHPRWSVLFGPITDLPFGDADLWEDHQLPVAADAEAYPFALRLEGDEVRRPDAGTLAYLEGLLAAFADTTEDDIDTGRWTKRVETHDGAALYRLAIPALLEPLDAPPAVTRGRFPDRRAMERVTAETPVERAQDLAYRAFEARGRRRIQLARKALELSRDCADAWVLLGEHAPDPERAMALYAEGVSAGERALGAHTFAEEAGHFWDRVETRPYMRARCALAEALEALDRRDEALDHYRELLRLNPNDNQGVRDLMLPLLIVGGRDDEALALLDRYPDDPSAVWRYGRALVTYQREGESAAAAARLREALRANRRVAKYLHGAAAFPEQEPERYAFGSEEEAVIAARTLAEAWRSTPGAAEWLAAAAEGRRGGKKRRR